MFADVSEPAPYYCQVEHWTAWWAVFGQLSMPEYYCNSVDSTFQFNDPEARETVKGASCFKQCLRGQKNSFFEQTDLYTTLHECNPALCKDFDGEETFPDLYQGDYEVDEGEKEYDISSFAKFDLEFMFSIFITVKIF